MERTQRKKPKARSARKGIALAVIGLAWVGMLLIWWPRHPPNLGREAERMFDAVLRADGDVLMDYAFEEEIAANDLSPRKLERLFREFILPKQQFVRWAERFPTESNEHTGYTYYLVENRYGKLRPYGATVYATGGRAKSPVLRQVFLAWLQEYYNSHPVPSSNLESAKAILAGLRKDTEKLKALGITSLSDVDFTKGRVKIVSLDGLAARYEKWIQDLEAKAKQRAESR